MVNNHKNYKYIYIKSKCYSLTRLLIQLDFSNTTEAPVLKGILKNAHGSVIQIPKTCILYSLTVLFITLKCLKRFPLLPFLTPEPFVSQLTSGHPCMLGEPTFLFIWDSAVVRKRNGVWGRNLSRDRFGTNGAIPGIGIPIPILNKIEAH